MKCGACAGCTREGRGAEIDMCARCSHADSASGAGGGEPAGARQVGEARFAAGGAADPRAEAAPSDCCPPASGRELVQIQKDPNGV